jgi:hypothetical protein
MGAILYLLRQQPDRISPSLFQGSDTDIEIVFIAQATSINPSGIESMAAGGSRTTLTYDDLVEKIFSSEHSIVL